MPKGGFRTGSGRKYKFGEKTEVIRIPKSIVPELKAYLSNSKTVKLPIFQNYQQITTADPTFLVPLVHHSIAAGFPSPAEDYIEGRIDLNEHLIIHKDASFILRVSGWSMVNAGIFDGDEIIVDRAVIPKNNHIVVAVIDGQLTVKRLYKKAGSITLVAENPDFPPIHVKEADGLMIWGVVIRVLHKV